MRFNLGLVRYHAGTESASHDYYMRELGVRKQCRYPGFSEDPKEAFLGLAHDLAFADDFLTGNGALLQQAAKRESSDNAARNAELITGYVGDKQKVEHLRRCFRQGKYEDAIAEFKALKYPERLSESDRKMVELARKRTHPSRTGKPSGFAAVPDSHHSWTGHPSQTGSSYAWYMAHRRCP